MADQEEFYKEIERGKVLVVEVVAKSSTTPTSR
jgi:hypothetical protein